MKFVVFFALLAIGYVNSEHITDYGEVKGRPLNIDYVFSDRAMYKIQNKTVTLPRVKYYLNFSLIIIKR